MHSHAFHPMHVTARLEGWRAGGRCAAVLANPKPWLIHTPLIHTRTDGSSPTENINKLRRQREKRDGRRRREGRGKCPPSPLPPSSSLLSLPSLSLPSLLRPIVVKYEGTGQLGVKGGRGERGKGLKERRCKTNETRQGVEDGGVDGGEKSEGEQTVEQKVGKGRLLN